MPWPQTGVTQYHAQLGLPDKGRAIKWLVVCTNRDIEPLDLQNGLDLGCYQPYSEVLIVLNKTDLSDLIDYINQPSNYTYFYFFMLSYFRLVLVKYG